MLKCYNKAADDTTTLNETAVLSLKKPTVPNSCGVDFCLNREKEKDLYSIVHFNNFSIGAIPPSPLPEKEVENLFGTTEVGTILIVPKAPFLIL